MDELNEEQVHALAAAFQEKAKLHSWIEDQAERERALIEQVIIDTWLTVSGVLPFDAWVNPVVPISRPEGVSGPEKAPERYQPTGREAGTAAVALAGLVMGSALLVAALVMVGARHFTVAAVFAVTGWPTLRYGWRLCTRLYEKDKNRDP